tara:strand:- start:333 stop:482 length:150 start_codon:yes stop_codon:yes gene_type:complete
MFLLRLKAAYFVLFKWTGCSGKSEKKTSFICGDDKEHVVVSISKPRILK